jgi:TonB family protein
MNTRSLIMGLAISWVTTVVVLSASTQTFTGTALLDVDYDSGRVTAVHLLESTGNPKLDASIIRSLSKWRMKAHRVTHVKVPVRVNLASGNLESTPPK